MINVSHSNKPVNVKGKVWIVGAGTGDPELLTLKAHRVLSSADLILFDQLVSHEIREIFPQAVPAFYVGKSKGNHSIAQTDLNQSLIKKARQGLNVVRLKGGDPFVFGRGSEEMLELVNAGIETEVVPGITAASGATSAACIPLTHRGISQGCTFITAHAEKHLGIDWESLSKLNHTLVFYMGVSQASIIEQSLRSHGFDMQTPVAIIENGSRHNQREIIGCLSQLTHFISFHEVVSPALIVVGDVVRLSGQLKKALLNPVGISIPQAISA